MIKWVTWHTSQLPFGFYILLQVWYLTLSHCLYYVAISKWYLIVRSIVKAALYLIIVNSHKWYMHTLFSGSSATSFICGNSSAALWGGLIYFLNHASLSSVHFLFNGFLATSLRTFTFPTSVQSQPTAAPTPTHSRNSWTCKSSSHFFRK